MLKNVHCKFYIAFSCFIDLTGHFGEDSESLEGNLFCRW